MSYHKTILNTAHKKIDERIKFFKYDEIKESKNKIQEDISLLNRITRHNPEKVYQILDEHLDKLTPNKMEQIYNFFADIYLKYDLKLEKEDIINFISLHMYIAVLEQQNENIAINKNLKQYIVIKGKVDTIRYFGEVYNSDDILQGEVEVYLRFPGDNKIEDMINMYKKINRKTGLGVWNSIDFEFKNVKIFAVEYLKTPRYKMLDRCEILEILLDIIPCLKIMNEANFFVDVYLTDIGMQIKDNSYEYTIKRYHIQNLNETNNVKKQFMLLFRRFEEVELIKKIFTIEDEFLYDDISHEILKMQNQLKF